MKRLMIAGFGDVARRALPRLEDRFEVLRIARRYGSDLHRPSSLALEGVHALLHCAPPPGAGESDTRTAHLLAALEKGRILPARVVYVRRRGVYCDCAGARLGVSRSIAPQTPRARRRGDAERRLGLWCEWRGIALIVLRAPGIYAADRLPLERLRAGTPVLRAEDDVYTSHIHADDLAAAAVRALADDAPAGAYNIADDTEMKMADWLDLVAEHAGLPRPQALFREEARWRLPPQRVSFMTESRRLDNRRMKQVLGVRLRYPTVHEGLRHEHALGVD